MSRIFGKHTVLRELRWEDLGDMRSWVTDPETTAFLGGRYRVIQTWEETENDLRGMLEGSMSGIHFAIAQTEKLRYIGQLSLTGIDAVQRSANVTIVLVPEYQNQGHGTEALQLGAQFAFCFYNLHRLSLQVHADNLRALRAYEKAGFQVEGCLREAAFRDGKYIDVIQMGMLQKDIQAPRII